MMTNYPGEKVRMGLDFLIRAIEEFSSLPEEERFRTLIQDISRLVPIDFSVLMSVHGHEGYAKILYCFEKPELNGEVLPFSECPELFDLATPHSSSRWRRLSADSRLLAHLGVTFNDEEDITTTVYPVAPENSNYTLLLVSSDVGFPENSLEVLEQIEKASEIFLSGNTSGTDLLSKDDPHKTEEPDIQMIGACEDMRRLFSTIRKFASVDAPVLITGESGTGKELAAESIHERSSRKNGPLIAINCGAIPENLLESELFGHEKGSFTGAHVQKKGKVEMAHGGTLFLDEIGELSLSLQVKLLRFLEAYRFERVGGTRSLEVNVRVIAATNKDLMQAIKRSEFREDLYYRLAVLSLSLPPLRKRGEDVIIMSRVFLKQYAEESNHLIKGFTQEAIEAIKSHDWPGNIRELVNTIRRAVVLTEEELITPADLGLAKARQTEGPTFSLVAARERLERDLIKEALSCCEGNIAKAARELGVSRPHLYGLMKKHQLSPKSTREPS